MFSNGIVQSSNRPSCRNQFTVFSHAHRSHGKGFLDLGQWQAILVELNHRICGFEILIVKGLLQSWLPPYIPHPEFFQGCARTKRLMFLVEKESAGFMVKFSFGID